MSKWPKIAKTEKQKLKKRKRKGEGVGEPLASPWASAHPSRPTHLTSLAGPAPRSAPPFLFPWCAPLQGRDAARPPRRQRRGWVRAPPLDASTSSPPTSTHSPARPLCLSHSPPDSPSSFPLSRTRACSPPRLDCTRGHRAPFASPSSPSSPPPSSTQSPSVSASREPLRGADRAAPFRLCRRRTPSSPATAAATNLTPGHLVPPR